MKTHIRRKKIRDVTWFLYLLILAWYVWQVENLKNAIEKNTVGRDAGFDEVQELGTEACGRGEYCFCGDETWCDGAYFVHRGGAFKDSR